MAVPAEWNLLTVDACHNFSERVKLVIHRFKVAKVMHFNIFPRSTVSAALVKGGNSWYLSVPDRKRVLFGGSTEVHGVTNERRKREVQVYSPSRFRLLDVNSDVWAVDSIELTNSNV